MKKESHEELSKKRKELIPIKENESFSEVLGKEKSANINEGDLEKFEPVIEKINQLTNEIEANTDLIVERAKDPSLIEKNQQILSELYKRGEIFYKEVSGKLATYGRGLAESFRDKNISNKANKCSVRLNNSSSINNYKNLSYLYNKRESSFLKENKIKKEKANKSFDYIYQSVLPMLKATENDNWGKSVLGQSAKRHVNYLLSNIVDKAIILEKYDEVFNIIEIYKKNLSLTSSNDDNKYFVRIIYKMAKQFDNDRQTITCDKISAICRNEPFLSIEYSDHLNFDKNDKQNFVEQQIDKIIIESKDDSCCNIKANGHFAKCLRANPEKYGQDPKNISVIFESFKSDALLNYDFSYLNKNFYFFNQSLNSLSEADIGKIIKSHNSYQFKESAPQLIYSCLNLQEDNYKQIFDKFEKNLNMFEKKEYTKENLLQYFKSATDQYVPFFKYKDFNLDPEERITMFQKIAQSGSREFSFGILTQVLSNFEEISQGLPEEQFEETMNILIKNSIDGGVEDIRIMLSLLPGYNIPAKYKEQINAIFSEKYSVNNSDKIEKVLGLNKDIAQLSDQDKWLANKKELTPPLELAFYDNGNYNEFRHFFFDVIDGKQKSVNQDLLFKKYAERTSEINPEEYIDLFIVKKKIPMEYSGIFLKKVSNGNSLLTQLGTCLRLNQITEIEHNNILIDLVNCSNFQTANKSLDICLEKNLINNDEKVKLFESFATNLIKQMSNNYNSDSYSICSIMEGKFNSESIDGNDKKIFFKSIFNEILKVEDLHHYILEINNNNYRYFQEGFADDVSKEDFLNQLFQSNNSTAISRIIDSYFLRQNSNQENNNNAILSTLNEQKLNQLFDHGQSLKGLKVDNVLLGWLENMPQDKKDILIKKFLSKSDILDGAENKYAIKDFCTQIAFNIEKDISNTKERLITEDDAKNLSSRIFSSKYINEETFSELINYRQGFLRSDPEIMNQCALSLNEKGNVNNCFNLLTTFESNEKPILTEEQVKMLSIKILDNKNLDDKIYKMYLNSTDSNLKFYLDQDLLDKNVNRINNYNINIGPTINFIKLQQKIKLDNIHGKITLTTEQGESLNEKLLLQQYMSSTNFEELYDLDSAMFRKVLDKVILSKKLPLSSIDKIIISKNEIPNEYFSKIVDYYLLENNNNSNYIFDKICDRYSVDPILLNEIKEKVNSINMVENRSIYKSKLLQRDLLNQDELKAFYEEIRAEPNVYSQVLLSAEVLGSLVYSDSKEKKDNSFKSENAETQKNIEFISRFVNKYEKESKGRSIAVMLFSSEYLPDRNMDEVIAKVADTLSKHEKVLDQFKYDGIPEGLKVSIGMEYEITGSTAAGYKELKNRELKNDIVRLSQAAHIGNGKDAVHEIATRPATNPYLMLLEMQLLHDIEYVDFNFDKTTQYQKGSRGYHLTIGGETGLYVDANTNFLQNTILAASWGGIHAGEIGKRVSGGRGVTLRGRSANGGNNNIQVFDKPTDSVELRSLSIDKMEQFQRAVVTAYNGAIAIQALQKCTNRSTDQIYKFFKDDSNIRTEAGFVKELKDSNYLKNGYDSNEKNMKIVYAWAQLTSQIKDAISYHNNEFLQGETLGYLDEDGVWIDSKDFGGDYNSSRFNSVVSSIDPTLSVQEYVNGTHIELNKLFSSFDTEFADSLTKTNNLFLKPGSKKIINKDGKEISIGGDQANSISMLEVTKLNNENLEYRNDDSYLRGTVFENMGERREGYYCVQGGSEKMISHACQIALLNFNKRIEELVN